MKKKKNKNYKKIIMMTVCVIILISSVNMSFVLAAQELKSFTTM